MRHLFIQMQCEFHLQQYDTKSPKELWRLQTETRKIGKKKKKITKSKQQKWVSFYFSYTTVFEALTSRWMTSWQMCLIPAEGTGLKKTVEA